MSMTKLYYIVLLKPTNSNIYDVFFREGVPEALSGSYINQSMSQMFALYQILT